ncbi:hypothetical protein [Hydrogenophaga sp.]|uniref:hypothetical protein n=1 Tax=Hydrogenophaga sp. TaxID=1904254 RepID=UPI003D0F7B9F
MDLQCVTDAQTLEGVTPTTAALLGLWFGQGRAHARSLPAFDEAQRRAILSTIAAHETGREQRRSHCVALPTGDGRVAVLQALLIWQLLNHLRARASGRDDPRFVRRFLVVAPGLIAYERLLDAFCGKPIPGGQGARDIGNADIVRWADRLVPEPWRQEVFAFVCGNICGHREIGVRATGGGLLALAHRRLLVGGHAHKVGARHATGGVALPYLARLPELMVFDDETHPIPGFVHRGCATDVAWQACLHRIAEPKGRRFLQVSFLPEASGGG